MVSAARSRQSQGPPSHHKLQGSQLGPLLCTEAPIRFVGNCHSVGPRRNFRACFPGSPVCLSDYLDFPAHTRAFALLALYLGHLSGSLSFSFRAQSSLWRGRGGAGRCALSCEKGEGGVSPRPVGILGMGSFWPVAWVLGISRDQCQCSGLALVMMWRP